MKLFLSDKIMSRLILPTELLLKAQPEKTVQKLPALMRKGSHAQNGALDKADPHGLHMFEKEPSKGFRN